jgi:hypothetical protein
MRNLTFKAAMLNDSRTTVNRQSTDGQSRRTTTQNETEEQHTDREQAGEV